jgi:hypothetical protein
LFPLGALALGALPLGALPLGALATGAAGPAGPVAAQSTVTEAPVAATGSELPHPASVPSIM